MSVHKNARLTPKGRALLVSRVRTERWPVAKAARAAGISQRTAFGWLARHRAGGELALQDRSSAPARCPHRTDADNGSAYKSHAYRDLMQELGIRHKRTRPYTPRTNGKAERFIQTSLREWAYATAYHSSAERTEALQPWLTTYNSNRNHSALGGQPPFKWLTNLPGFDN
jgi:transposase InsO family protein